MTPLGRDIRATQAALAEGRSAIAEIPERRGGSPAARMGPFKTEPEFPRSKARRLDLGSQYAIVAARQCLADAGYDMASREERTGILLGTGSAGAGPLTEFERQMAVESPEAASPMLFPYTVANAPASLVAIELQIRGPNVTIIQKDPAALNALFYGRMLLADGKADALLVGAADEWNALYHQGFERVLATRTSTRPGFALGEGASVVLIEREEAARARGARLHARVAGLAMRTARISPHRRRAEVEELEDAMRSALEEAHLQPDGIDLVHLAANGTSWMDLAEREGLSRVFGERMPRNLAIKEQIGENPCSGAAQLSLGALAVSEGAKGVLIDSFGAGGNFFSAVLTPV